MKLEVDYMVEVLENAIKPILGNGSAEISNLDLTTELGFTIECVIYDGETNDLTIIAPDRPEKSAVIGKGGWVVGKLREALQVNNIHVDAYSDMMVRIYRMELALKKINGSKKILGEDTTAIQNLKDLLNLRINNLAKFNYLSEFEEGLKQLKMEGSQKKLEMEKDHKAIVALSGGVDSSFSLIVAKLLGFNPVAVTVDPGSIILPSYFKKNINGLTSKLNVSHEYLPVNMGEVIENSLEGRIHPCGKCSKTIEDSLLEYAEKSEIPFIIFGDFLATGSQSTVRLNGFWRLNLPAMLSATKGETRSVSGYFDVESVGGYGCPLLNEVHKLHPHMRRFSIQRVLRETRAGVIEPGQALNLITRDL